MKPAVYGAHTPDAWREWRRWGGDNYEVTDEGVRVARERTPTYVDPVRLDARYGALRTVDIVLGDCDTLFVLSEGGAVHRDDRDDGVLDRFFETGDALEPRTPPFDPRRLAVAAETVYLADETRVVAVDRSTVAERALPADPPFETVVSMVADRRDAFVLGTNADGGIVVRASFDGPNGGFKVVVGGGDAVPNPLDIAIDAEGNLYVLSGDSGGASPVVHRYDRDDDAATGYETTPTVVAVDTVDGRTPGPTCIEIADIGEILLGARPSADDSRNLLRYVPDRGTFDPVRTVGGVPEALVRRRGARGRDPGLYVLGRDADGAAVWFLAATETNRPSPATGRHEARLVRRFDAGEAAAEWRRVTVAHELAGAGTQLRLRYAATDEDVPESAVEWRSLGVPNPTDALLSDATGRYLWVALDVVGTETASPVVSAFEVSLPRASYLDLLPAVYREDPASAEFLDRFLSAFERVFLDIEAEIDDLPSLLDARGIDAAALEWLEGWLALGTDETWPESNRRLLLERAPALFRARGTRTGLLDLLRVYLDDVEPPAVGDEAWERACRAEREILDGLVAAGVLGPAGRARIETEYTSLPGTTEQALLTLLEASDLDCIDDAAAREPYRRLVPCPQCFVVLVAPSVDAERRRGVDRIVDAERPAHAVGRGVGLPPWIELGGHTYLGMNSALPTREFVVDRSSLGRDTTLVDAGGPRTGGRNGGGSVSACDT